ncbi:hypothetical protein [Methylomonas sp. CM2]|uniref:hypothetical protein n=1 Tax=Methylomonas sp. CM2 TaxID=3417647 RepID=UPI003CEA1069
MKIYQIRCDNRYRVPLLVDSKASESYLEGKEWISLLDSWQPLPFYFYSDPKDIRKGWDKRADICAYLEGLFIPQSLLDTIFPAKPPELEFSPVLIDGEDWLLLNCLKTTKDYDPERSKFHRDNDDRRQIYMIDYVVIHDPTVESVGLFTLEDSNRSTLFATQTFVDHIHQLGLKGISFREIGILEPR